MKKRAIDGFSLLEVMVALAILAISFTTLILVQARATKMATEAKKISTSTQLARYQLMECKREVEKNMAATSDFKSQGDFHEIGQPDFTWECHAPRFNMKQPSSSQLADSVKKNTAGAKQTANADTSSVSAPIMGMIIDSLGNAVRELTVIIRWKDGDIEDETRVVTHVVDLTSIAVLNRMLSQGVKTLEEMTGKKKEQDPSKNPGELPFGPPSGSPPPQPREMPGELP